jgi:DNA-binding NarL/FixJ family response regulator
MPAPTGSAQYGHGAVLLAEGRPEDALPALHDACRRWHRLQAPYEVALSRLLLARAYAALGDGDTATLESEAAGATLAELGAARAGSHAAAPPDAAGGTRPGGLTGREVEVLALMATGATNRRIAAELGVSGKTVARHLADIFSKLRLSSRAAAAAYAVEHRLVAEAAATPRRG